MFWADKLVEQIKTKYASKIASGEALVLRDEKTLSGAPHFGSMRSMAIHALLSEVLNERNIANTYYYEINDFDPMDDIPAYLDRSTYEQHLGKPLCLIPAPDGSAVNYAEYYAEGYIHVLEKLGVQPQYNRLSELYFSGRMNNVIRTALEQSDAIRDIYRRVSGGVREPGWLPISIICESCGKMSTTRASNFDGQTVSYRCAEGAIAWINGCGHGGRISPFNGQGKLLWKVDWAAKFKVMNVDIEAAGKDHYTKGGSRHVVNAISDEVFNFPHPHDIPHEFFLIGGKKMSSSKGRGISALQASELMPPHIFRLALLGRDPARQSEFNPSGDTVPVLFDEYDKLADYYYGGREDDYARAFALIHEPDDRSKLPEANHFRLRFSQVAFLSQMPHIDIEQEAEKIKTLPLTDSDKIELKDRVKYAKVWLDKYAPEEYKFTLHIDDIPKQTADLSEQQKTALGAVLEYVTTQDNLDGQTLHTELHEIRKNSGLEPKEFFAALYVSFLGKPYGPKAGWFLSVLGKHFIVSRLSDVASQ